MNIYLQESASKQPRTSRPQFADISYTLPSPQVRSTTPVTLGLALVALSGAALPARRTGWVGAVVLREGEEAVRNVPVLHADLGDLYMESGQTSQCSLSSVSTSPIA